MAFFGPLRRDRTVRTAVYDAGMPCPGPGMALSVTVPARDSDYYDSSSSSQCNFTLTPGRARPGGRPRPRRSGSFK